MQHDQFQDMLDELVKQSGVGQEVLGDVLARTSLQAPKETSRVEISAGNPTARRPSRPAGHPPGHRQQGREGTEGPGASWKTARNSGGPRTAAPLRRFALGSRYAMAGVKVMQAGSSPGT